MNALYDWAVEVHLHSPHLFRALITGTLVSTVCGVVGCFIILRRAAFLADALAHAMLAGVVCGYLLMKRMFAVEASAPAMLIGSIVAGMITVVMVGFVSRFSRLKEDTVIGIMYTSIFALGGLLLSLFSKDVLIDLAHFLTGNVLAVENSDLWMMGLVAAVVLTAVILFFRPLQLISFDRVMAASLGIPVLAMDYLLTGCTSLVVVSGVNVVGVILVVGLLIIPAATAYLLCDRLSRMLVVAALFGWTSFLAGYLLSEQINVASGSAIVVASAAQFAVVLVVAPRYGLAADWLRRWRAIPQQTIEDILGCVLRAPGKQVRLNTILEHVRQRSDRVRRALRRMDRDRLVTFDGQTVALTDRGRVEARRLLRAHRLWETYLEHLGTPAEELHDRAHRLEHVHDEATVDYLDDKLGHPTHDPHGKEIPEDFVHLVPGAQVKSSLLREGREGRVTAIGKTLESTPLAVGMRITAGPRAGDDDRWTFVLPDGNQITLDHEAADALTVQLADTPGEEPASERVAGG